MRFGKKSLDIRRPVSVLVIHGINTNSPDFDGKLRKRVLKKLGLKHKDYLEWRAAYWADITRDSQGSYLEKVQDKYALGYSGLRRWVVEGLGDAAAYQLTDTSGQDAYSKIQERVLNAMLEMAPKDGEERPLIIVAHSLGCHIASTLIHDMNKHGQKLGAEATSQERFMSMQTLSGVVTMGCNMPLFTFAFRSPDVVPIEFPDGIQKRFGFLPEWHNFFARTDVLGFPLRTLNGSYRDAVWRDVTVRTRMFSGMTPLSHNHYWTHKTVVSDIARLIELAATADPDDPDSVKQKMGMWRRIRRALTTAKARPSVQQTSKP